MPIKIAFLIISCVAAISLGCAPDDSERNSSIEKPTHQKIETGKVTQEKLPEPATEYPVMFGDFNDDGKRDQARFVRSSTVPVDLPESFILVRGWPHYGESEAPTHPKDGGPISLLIQHDADADPLVTSSYLLFDSNEISILSADAAMGSTTMSVSDLSEQRELPDLPSEFSGDIIIIPSEAGIDTYLYWNGKRYTSHEPLEMP